MALATILFFVASGSRLFGYALEGPSWPAGSTVNVRLAFTGPSSGHLQDGFTTFNASAANALALWNQQIQLAKFSWTTSSIGGAQRDGQNTAFFSSTVYGQTYGQAIAVTIYFYNGETMHEADNLFNSALLWDSYRGPLQYNARKGKYVFDFHRVAPVMDEAKVSDRGSVAIVFCFASRHWPGASALAGGCPSTG